MSACGYAYADRAGGTPTLPQRCQQCGRMERDGAIEQRIPANPGIKREAIALVIALVALGACGGAQRKCQQADAMNRGGSDAPACQVDGR